MTRIARILLPLTVATAVLIPAGAASARPVIDQPTYCGPGTSYVHGHCVGKGVWRH